MFSRIADGRQRQSISAALYAYGLVSYAGRCVVGLNRCGKSLTESRDVGI